MKRQYFTVLFTLVCVLGLGLGARAQECFYIGTCLDTVVAKVPHDFVVGGQVLPAGMYRVSRLDTTRTSRTLEISSYEKRTNTVLIPTLLDDSQIGHTQLNFEHVGDTYFLSGIETPTGTYVITIPRSAINFAKMKQQGSSSSEGN
jgi:hypothetical protein